MPDERSEQSAVAQLLAYRYARALRRPVLVRGAHGWHRVRPQGDYRLPVVFLLVW